MIEQGGSIKQWEFVLYDGLALFHMCTGRFEEALKDYEKAWEIAVELKLSAKTISTYRSRILAKMDLRSNAEVIRYAIIYGLGE